MGILAVILAILALLCAVLATVLFGTTGAIIATVLAVAAVALAVFKRIKTQKGGIAAIVIAVLSVILAFALSGTWSAFFKELHTKAVEQMPDSIWAQVSENYNDGVMGIIRNLPTDEASLNKLMDEMNELNKLSTAE